ncbi:MAG: sulfotransferase family protein [Ardenticatenaceae bacterium]|nr:MAG: sulfotransferase family protein [Ardenticatenaceae bacterium]
MSLKVIGSGFGRTGTLSLKAALEILGFDPCYHMEAVIKRPSHINMWYQIGQGQSVPWQKIFGSFHATVDYPASIFYQELLATYPDAKVVHTVRDPDRWYDSTAATIYRVVNDFPFWVPKLFPWLARFIDLQEQLVWQKIFNGRFPDRAYAIQRFQEHTNEVRQHVPTEKLLIFQVKEGWEPLCDFLNVPIPNVPFPHINDREMILRRFKLLQRLLTWLPISLALLIGFLLFRLFGKKS